MEDIDGQEIQVGDVVQILNPHCDPAWRKPFGKVERLLEDSFVLVRFKSKIKGHYAGSFKPEFIFCLFYRKTNKLLSLQIGKDPDTGIIE